jgi:hypothetical protein
LIFSNDFFDMIDTMIPVLQVICLLAGLGVIAVVLLLLLKILHVLRSNEAKFHRIMQSFDEAREPALLSLRHIENILAESKVIAEQTTLTTKIVQDKLEKIDVDAINGFTTQVSVLTSGIKTINSAMSESVLPPILRMARLSRAVQKSVDAFLARLS